MSVGPSPSLPDGGSADRAAAKESLWRLAAAAFGHPAPELQDAIESGRFHDALDSAWGALTGRAWPRSAPSPDFAALEAGYITAFLHGPKGKPVASLLAGDHESLLAGHARPVFMLNISAFYRHFGLAAAQDDEGRADEPDHLASLLEFMAVLSHLEGRALGNGKDPSPLWRAQRDVLRRYVVPLLALIDRALRAYPVVDLDPILARLVEDLPAWGEMLATELEVRVGPYRDPDTADAGLADASLGGAAQRSIDQNLWG